MSSRTALERMKTKNFFMVVVLVLVSIISLWIITSPTPNLKKIVRKTSSGIWKASASIPTKAEQALTIDPGYLVRLGLAQRSKDGGANKDRAEPIGTALIDAKAAPVPFFLPPPMTTSGKPVVASGVKPDFFKDAAVLMKSIQTYLPDYKVVMYDLGLSNAEQILLSKHCNKTWNCESQKFQFEKFPSHVKYLSIHSYRPICIQEMLKKYGAVIWVDDGMYFTSGNLTSTLDRARQFGIQGWTIKDPTSSFTHQKMFQFFQMNRDDYYFQHAMESSHLVIYNTENIARELMLPWVKCALLEECINPPGAQDSGCNFFRKPAFRYTGCHKYDTSALNVILGKFFKFDESAYTSDAQVWGNLVEDQLRAENKTRPGLEMRLNVGNQL